MAATGSGPRCRQMAVQYIAAEHNLPATCRSPTAVLDVRWAKLNQRKVHSHPHKSGMVSGRAQTPAEGPPTDAVANRVTDSSS